MLALAVAAGLAVGLWAGRRPRGAELAASGLLERRFESMSSDLDRRLAALDQRLWLGLDTVQHAQSQAADVAADVRERVGTVAELARQVLDHARELGRLEDLLRPPQARGALGEVLLEQLLAQGLPSSAWRTQHAFRSGARVDAVLDLGGTLVPVDAKFPLEAFARMSSAVEGDAARTLHRRAFQRDARRHVDAIAEKYICPDEGTFDFALCYVPSEAVYYEFLREEAPGDSSFRYAVSRRVFPVSPTTLYAYLISIGLGLRGMRVEANARRVLDALTGLQAELGRLRDDFEVVGRHLSNARTRWDEAARRLDRFDGRLAEVSERAGELETAREREDDGGPDEAGPAAGPLTGTG
jgi:DNA recombination protein RmuC